MPYNVAKYAAVVANHEAMVAFWAKVSVGPDCWEWTGVVNARYGKFRNCYAHRLAYTDKIGPVAGDVTLDHLCRNRLCVRPSHLEPTDVWTNTSRGLAVTAANAAKTACHKGHPLSERRRGDRVRRFCKDCAYEYRRRTVGAKAEYDRQRRSS